MSDFIIQKKIYYHDTDCGGVVYYGRYLEHLEEGKDDFFREKGIDLAAYAKKGFAFAVVHLDIDYKSPARYGDTVKISTRVEKIGNTSIHFYQEISKESVLVKAKTIWACIGPDFKVQAVPQKIKETLA